MRLALLGGPRSSGGHPSYLGWISLTFQLSIVIFLLCNHFRFLSLHLSLYCMKGKQGFVCILWILYICRRNADVLCSSETPLQYISVGSNYAPTSMNRRDTCPVISCMYRTSTQYYYVHTTLHPGAQNHPQGSFEGAELCLLGRECGSND